MLQTPPKPLTLAEFLKLPETKPASEYIDGQILPEFQFVLRQLKATVLVWQASRFIKTDSLAH